MRLTLDTGVIIAFAATEKDKSLDSIEKILNLTKSKKLQTFISSMTISEIYSYFYKKKYPKKAVEICSFLEEIGIVTIDMNKEIAKNSGVLKSKYSMSFADAIILATCTDLNAYLITYDPELLDVKEAKILKPEEFTKMLKNEEKEKQKKSSKEK